METRETLSRILNEKVAQWSKTAGQKRPLCPADQRIQDFVDGYLASVCPKGGPRLPSNTFILDQPGLARVMCFPTTSDDFASTFLKSYRTHQGVLHNPKSDRRTTMGLFHIVEEGFPIPDDKMGVPKKTFAAILERAFNPPDESMTLPFASTTTHEKMFVSLLMRPAVCPATDTDPVKSMEIRFFAPAALTSNLDFVENIFGNAGDPYLPENDAALDVEHWTGHTGCVILAPHLTGIKKKDVGLPHVDDATERQRRDGMCWKSPDELYNNGGAFKLACRDSRGIMLTIIGDNYYGYCKKEVKTQISFSANIYGLAEEEHAGGALAYPTYVLGQDFIADKSWVLKKTTFEEAMAFLGDRAEIKPERYAVDKTYPTIFYVPENAAFNVREGSVRWTYAAGSHQLPLRQGDVFILPSGYKIRLEQQIRGTTWRLVGSRPDGTFCHKPCTVSGGGKSEISKSIAPMIQSAPVFVKDFQKDFDRVAEILKMDFSRIHKQSAQNEREKRPILSPERSLGSVVKLLTPSTEYTDDYNTWLRELPQTIRRLVFVVKRYYRPEWGDQWREHFSVDRTDGYAGHELKYHDLLLKSNYLRVGFEPDGAWRMYKLRPDFNPADKVQMEDDISVTVVLPRDRVSDLNTAYPNQSVKLVLNCEEYLFQRPDDAIHRGFDAQAEADIATPGTFFSNFEPMGRDEIQLLLDQVAEFDLYTQPMQDLLHEFLEHPKADYVVSSAHPRLVNGKPSKNPRYLQRRPDIVNHRDRYVAEIGARINREISADRPVHFPVRALLPGRRNNKPEPSIHLPSLAVYSPLHYQELPELFMDFLCSITGKSPSTTGFGSEGGLTKGPFNALWPVVDMNNALVSMILTGYAGFSSAADHIGPNYSVEHDISMLVPEVWCRMEIQERDPQFLIQNGFLEKVNDFVYEGRRVQASRLGYRITSLFADRFLGRIFELPNSVFTDELLRPEKQDLGCFVEGVDAIVEAQTRVAKQYFNDGSVNAACPPLKALLHIMAKGAWEGKDVNHPEFRKLFTRDYMIASDWYQERLHTKQQRDITLWKRHIGSLESLPAETRKKYEQRLAFARKQLVRVSAPAYLKELEGTLGADPFHLQMPASEPAKVAALTR
jgi:phosphoenolpyruvate carboxykinase (diphosphate)